MLKLKARQLRDAKPEEEHKSQIKKNPIYIVLDDVLDTYNIGAVFRLADAVAATKVILCAGSETPPNTRIKRASINTTEWVDWEYFDTAEAAIKDLRSKIKDLQVISVELDKRAVPYTEVDYNFPVAIVVGHETDGVSEAVLKLSDHIGELPMYGVNIRLNVMESLGRLLCRVIEKM